MMKLKNIFAAAILAIGATSLPSMAETSTISWSSQIGSYNYSWQGCNWQKWYENGYNGTAYYYYKPVGACLYKSLSVTSNGIYATLSYN